MKKYEFTGEVKSWLGHTLHQIRATVSFGTVNKGDLGGWIEKEDNLAQDGDAWVYGDARVFGDARVCGNAWVYGDAWVYKAQSHHLVIGPIGSRAGATTFFRAKDLKIYVACGCFQGDIDAFATAVRNTHGDNTHAKMYLQAIEMAKMAIDLTPEEVKECTQEDAPAADVI